MKTRLPTIQEATHSYETWLGEEMTLLSSDLELKHQLMAADPFSFLRATYYRWAQHWPLVCQDLLRAPEVLAVGDLHVENFGTWRDAEGRLVWGINDFDEATPLPYVQDLVRLATSARLAIEVSDLQIEPKAADRALMTGYRESLEEGGLPFVLAEHRTALRDMATHRLRDPQDFWHKLDALPTYNGVVPSGAQKALALFLPTDDLPYRVVHRVAGLGSLGRERFVALAEWQGGKIAREAKALALSAAKWAHGTRTETRILYQGIVDSAIRCRDPFVRVKRRWIVRRLAPDCSHILIRELGEERDAVRLLHAMGWETANIHLGSRTSHALLVDLAGREDKWLFHAAEAMLNVVRDEWEQWRDDPTPHTKPRKSAKAGKQGKESKKVKQAKESKKAKQAKPAKAAKAKKAAKAQAEKAAKTKPATKAKARRKPAPSKRRQRPAESGG